MSRVYRALHHYMVEVDSNDGKFIDLIKEALINAGCLVKFTGDVGLFYLYLFVCRDVTIYLGFRNAYYIDIVGKPDSSEKILEIVVKTFGKERVNVHYVIRII